MTSFEDLGLAVPLLQALAAEGYDEPTPVQLQAIPPIMGGRDVQGLAQTGTGKTAAFALPILHRLLTSKRPAMQRGCRVLVLAPTRELALQVAESFRTYGARTGLRVALMYGGVPKGRQAKSVSGGVDVLVATPGRLMDHVADRAVDLSATEVLVLDEADHMLDLGFIEAIRKIAQCLPPRRQSLFFSATMPPAIAKLAGSLLRDPARVAVAAPSAAAAGVAQSVMFVEAAQKRVVLAGLLRHGGMVRTLVFTRTRQGADRVVLHLEAAGIRARAIHGEKTQQQRERALAAFRDGSAPVLVATDIAARGIDVDGVSHVVNYDLPNVPEAYVHRIGRTARAGREGVAISFCDRSERGYLRGIEKLLHARVPVREVA